MMSPKVESVGDNMVRLTLYLVDDVFLPVVLMLPISVRQLKEAIDNAK